jgi:hypothetical protein
MFERMPPDTSDADLLEYDNCVAMAIGSEGTTSMKKMRNSANNVISPIRKIP